MSNDENLTSRNVTEIESATPSVTVVGVGASAGGIEALLPLLRNLPSDTNMAYVVVMHLDPGHASQLVEVLSRTTAMPTIEASEGMRIESNHLYVIPPNKLLFTSGGVLKLIPRSEVRGPAMPIDYFFHSLAEDFGKRAVGIVLSGTGSDGTLGLIAIKAADGITFAQDETAQHGGMPRSAIQAKCVDFILAPVDISAELVRISKHPYINGSGDEPAPQLTEVIAEKEEPYTVLFRMLRNATHVDFANYKRSTIQRRIQRRLLVHRLESTEEYLALVRKNPAELLALHKDLLIHVTRFFREPDAFEAVKTTVFPALNLERAAETPIRIWVPGCSTGEEVYSLAICLFEYLGENAAITPIKFFATDISEDALASARSGRYLENIAADVTPERLRRYFIKTEMGYQIIKSIRDLCVFARHDMTCDPPFSALDLISCRNVLIYLNPVLQKRVLPLFHYALKPGRFLILGASETIGTHSDLYDTCDAGNRIYTARATAARINFDFSSGGTAITDVATGLRIDRDSQGSQDLRSEADRLVLARYAPVGVIVNDNMEVLQFRGQTGAFLTPAPGNASLNVLKMARQGLLAELRAAIEESRKTGQPARREGLSVRTNDHYLRIAVQVIPMQFNSHPCFTVLFEEMPLPNAPSAGAGSTEESPRMGLGRSEFEHKAVQLQQELDATKEYLQSSIEKAEVSNEELKAANEEIISSNEELQSTNEELQTAKEELQASNEELSTVNEELQNRNREATRLSDDLANLIRSVNIPIVMVGQDLRIRQFTPSAAEVLKLIPTDVGRSISDLKPKLINADLERWMTQVLQNLVPLDHEVLDSEGHWYRVCLRPYLTQDNRIDGVVLSIIDIDVIKKSEQHLKQARDNAERILGTVHVPLVVLDTDFRLVAVNSAFCEFFKVTSDETKNRFLSDLGNRQWDIPTLKDLLEKTLVQGESLKDFVVEHEFPTIGNKVMLLNARLLDQSDANSPAILLAIEDITEREKATAVLREEQMRESQKMESLGRLAGGIAHDFNNLMTVVNGFCDTLRLHLSEDPFSLPMLDAIHAAGTRAASLTQQLLAYGRKQILQPREVDLNQILTNMESLLRRILNENVDIQLHLCPEPALAMIDPAQCEQIVMNLCLNAQDAMAQGGNLTLETCHVDIDKQMIKSGMELREGRHLRLTVKDNGSGMDAKTLARAFEPFFTTKEVGKGTGLGLASVYGIVKQSHGHVEAVSQPNRGTSILIYLPALQNVETPPLPMQNVSQTPATSKTILIVEDEDAIRHLEMTVLASQGFQLLQARNGAEALRLCGELESNIDLLITDVLMPGMSGYKLAQSLRSSRPNIKVLYVSGHSEELVRQQGIVVGQVHFLQKPFSPTSLINEVRKMLDK